MPNTKPFDLLNTSAFSAACVREVHKQKGSKIFIILDKAIEEYMKRTHPDILTKVKKEYDIQ